MLAIAALNPSFLPVFDIVKIGQILAFLKPRVFLVKQCSVVVSIPIVADLF